MAVKFIAETDSLEQFRLEFNDLSANQFGDIADLSGAITATNLVAAMNETISIATSTAGWTIADENSSIPRFTSAAAGKALTFDAVPLFNESIEFDGATAGTFKTTVTVTDPTADRTITIPDITGTIITTGDTNTITSNMIAPGALSGSDLADDSIDEAKIADDAVGQDQLKSVVNLQILNSSGGVLKSIYGAGA